MIIIAIIRISRVRAMDFNIWACFWQQLEGCVAILMVSLTAFRTVFAAKKRNPDQEKRKAMRSPKVDMSVPRGTLTGMETFINYHEQTPTTSFAGAKSRSCEQIHVTCEFSTRSENVSVSSLLSFDPPLSVMLSIIRHCSHKMLS